MAVIGKSKKKNYICYSGATSVTAEKLAESLNLIPVKEVPKDALRKTAKDTGVILFWGAKTKKDIALAGNVVALNHVNKIRQNRNKLNALDIMLKAGVNVAPYLTEDKSAQLGTGEVNFPVVARSKFHQGGKGFWFCNHLQDANHAKQAGAAYFQAFIHIADEYRIHMIDGEPIYAVKKIMRSHADHMDAYVRQHLADEEKRATKGGRDFNADALRPILERQAKAAADAGPDMIIRSVKRGWKFSHVKKVNKDLAAEAAKALKALGLDFGAVDCCTDTAGNHWIIEVNTGPGLEGTPYDAYVKALTKQIAEGGKVKKEAAKKPTKEGAVAAAAAAAGGTGNTKSDLMKKLEMAQEMTSLARDDSEAAALNSVFGRMFGKTEED